MVRCLLKLKVILGAAAGVSQHPVGSSYGLKLLFVARVAAVLIRVQLIG
jgi:hypothetical protein